eukprot:g1431.t1
MSELSTRNSRPLATTSSKNDPSTPSQETLQNRITLSRTFSVAHDGLVEELHEATPVEKENRWKDSAVSVAKSLLAGAAAGSVAKSVVAPLERGKIIFQIDRRRAFSLNRVRLELARIVNEEGYLALWRGHSATLLRIIPYAAIQFASFDYYSRIIGSNQWYHNLIAGSLAGATSVLFTYPLDVMRTRMAAQSVSEHSKLQSKHQRNVFQGMKNMIRTEGSLSLFRGMSATMIGIIPYAGLSWMVFTGLKKRVIQYTNADDVSMSERMFCGAIAGLVAQTVTYPLDTSRRRMQTDGFVEAGKRYSNVWSTLMRITKEEGVQALFKGVSMNWLKGPVAVSISFTLNDLIRKKFGIEHHHHHYRRRDEKK